MGTVRISDSVRTTLDANGNGTVLYNGPKPGQLIVLGQLSIQVLGTKKVPTFKLYKGTVTDANFVAGSVTGHNDTNSFPDLQLHPGEFVTGQWLGADAGTQATLILFGTMQYPGT